MDRRRETQVLSEWFDRLSSCINDAGFGATRTEDGIGLTFDSHGDTPALNAAISACEKDIGPAPSAAPLSAAEAGALYDAYLESKACLEHVGVAVTPPPSRPQFIDAYLASYSTHVAPWSPFYGAGEAHEKECPPPRLEDLDVQ